MSNRFVAPIYPLSLPVAALPAAANYLGGVVYCNNYFGETGALLVSDGAAWRPASGLKLEDLSPILARSTTTTTVVSTNVETEIFSYTIAAGLLGTERSLGVKLMGDLLNNTAANQVATVRIKANGTIIYNDSTGNITSSVSRRPWQMDLSFCAVGTSLSAYLSGLILIGVPGGATTGLGDLGAAGQREAVISSNGPVAFGLTQALTLSATVQLGNANAALDWRRLKSIVTLI
jgi:hypothetical protein